MLLLHSLICFGSIRLWTSTYAEAHRNRFALDFFVCVVLCLCCTVAIWIELFSASARKVHREQHTICKSACYFCRWKYMNRFLLIIIIISCWHLQIHVDLKSYSVAAAKKWKKLSNSFIFALMLGIWLCGWTRTTAGTNEATDCCAERQAGQRAN